MVLTKTKTDFYCTVLREELIAASGCTEPIAIAYAAAVATAELGVFPEHIQVQASGNLIKNAMGVVIPNSGGMKGISAAAILGALSGQPSLKLEVLSTLTKDDIKRANELTKSSEFSAISFLESDNPLHVIITLTHEQDTVAVEILENHTNVVSVAKNGISVFSKEEPRGKPSLSLPLNNKNSLFSVKDIITFGATTPLEQFEPLLRQQVDYNSTIAKEGLSAPYGAQVGKTLAAIAEDTVATRAKACAAAASDARMSGCTMPVVINSGSGNQGIVVSLPVIEYARFLEATTEELYRALAVSNLISIYIKQEIGRLSAYCGAVSAACGAGAGITFLFGGTEKEISDTITNTLANVSGIVCDGAKPSCAAKVASAVDAAILAHTLSMKGLQFSGGEGIVKDTVDATIVAVGQLAKDGMQQTDEEIISLMIDS